jgi:hypothetical protein
MQGEQLAVVGQGYPPESVTGEPREPLEFSVSPTLFTIRLSGNFTRQKV